MGGAAGGRLNRIVVLTLRKMDRTVLQTVASSEAYCIRAITVFRLLRVAGKVHPTT